MKEILAPLSDDLEKQSLTVQVVIISSNILNVIIKLQVLFSFKYKMMFKPWWNTPENTKTTE